MKNPALLPMYFKKYEYGNLVKRWVGYCGNFLNLENDSCRMTLSRLDQTVQAKALMSKRPDYCSMEY